MAGCIERKRNSQGCPFPPSKTVPTARAYYEGPALLKNSVNGMVSILDKILGTDLYTLTSSCNPSRRLNIIPRPKGPKDCTHFPRIRAQRHYAVWLNYISTLKICNSSSQTKPMLLLRPS